VQDTEPKRVIDMKGVNLRWEVEPEGISMVVPLSISLSIKLTIPDHCDVDKWRTGVEVRHCSRMQIWPIWIGYLTGS
jgi:hypothetical protein